MIRLYDFDEVRPEEILNRDIRAEADVEATVDAIIADVRARGDAALIEYAAKFVSLGMRLFGNMYAGELVFFLIALLGGFALELGPLGGVSAGLGQVAAGLVWWLFHVLIVLLQAFIFMMLTLVYIGQAHSSH